MYFDVLLYKKDRALSRQNRPQKHTERMWFFKTTSRIAAEQALDHLKEVQALWHPTP
jgi:hypothetical protein